ncbi:NusG domain II-containing protein [Paenibacillus stellifer]|nr:NusG domain II-containing protein [Paenibacillus stellifer]
MSEYLLIRYLERGGNIMKRGDWLIIMIGLLIAGSIYGIRWVTMDHSEYRPGELAAKILVDGKLYRDVSLTKDTQYIHIRTSFGHNTLKVYNYGIQMVQSDAPKTIALDMGFKSKPYQQIICIPNRVYVEVYNPHRSSSENEIDGVIHPG